MKHDYQLQNMGFAGVFGYEIYFLFLFNNRALLRFYASNETLTKSLLERKTVYIYFSLCL